MLPSFDVNGLLPPARHGAPYVCAVAELRQRFVDDLGAPEWRVQLFEGWEKMRLGIGDMVPSARWWLWGCFVSAHLEPLFGVFETLQAVVVLPSVELPRADPGQTLLVDFIAGAQERHRVDLAYVIEYPADHPEHWVGREALEFKWRPRATVNHRDHVTRELVPAGFVEVEP